MRLHGFKIGGREVKIEGSPAKLGEFLRGLGIATDGSTIVVNGEQIAASDVDSYDVTDDDDVSVQPAAKGGATSQV